MNLISLSIRRPVIAWMVMFGLIIFGAVSVSKLGISYLPDVDFPVINVEITYDGASPEVIEAELLDPIEQSLLNIESIKQVKSVGFEGTGRITIDFDMEANIDVALQEVQSSISQVRLPPGVDFPIIKKINPEEQPIMFLGIYSDQPMFDVTKYTDLVILDQLRLIPGIGEVSIAGFSVRNIRIWPDQDKLKNSDLTLLDLAEAINTQHLETSAGRFQNEKTEFRLRWLGEASTVNDIKNIRVLRRGGQVIQDRTFTIGDLAKVEDGLSDIRRLVRVEGKPSLAIGIKKQRGGNEVALARAVREKIEVLRKSLPSGYKIRENIDFTRATEASVDTTFHKLGTAAVVTIIICFLFLGSVQSAINILFSIPTSILGSFIVVYLCGFTLNTFTLLALTLAISIVVDDAIMLLENIVRHYRMGKSGAQAAYDGSMEILPAAVAASLAVIAVFLPVVFMPGITGKYFFQFGITLCSAVMFSLLEAVTITPMRSAALLRNNPKITKLEHYLDHKFEFIGEWFRSLLIKALHYPKSVSMVAIGLFIVSLSLNDFIKKEYVPAQDQDFIMITGETAPGTSLQETNAITYKVEEIIRKNKNSQGWLVSVGLNGANGSVNEFVIPLYLTPREKRDETHAEIMTNLRTEFSKIEGLKFNLRDNSTRGMTTGRMFPVSFNLSGPDLKVLRVKAAEIIKQLNQSGLTQDLNTDFKTGLPEVKISPDREKMLSMGVSVENVARTFSVALAGIRQNRFTADGRRVDIRIKVPEDKITSKKDIENITVRNNFGNLVPVGRFVTLIEEPTYLSILRLNRQRTIGVFGGLATNVSQAKALSEIQKISAKILPPGYSVTLEGGSAGLTEAFSSLTTALAIGVLVAYMILAIQFNSFLHPISVLVALPFSLTGALLALWVFSVSLNLFSFIGIIVLMGIAKKNSILLVEFANQQRERGKGIIEALGDAGATRLRPILMTSAATVFAALPLVVGDTMGQETRTPMGLVIIGGTIISTLFTLFAVPCIYLLLSKFESDHQKAVIEENYKM
jgi:hydrophobe/amphiphile efflux-1 (HAE1) family protein